jgi:AcrR family transcriptional regulator
MASLTDVRRASYRTNVNMTSHSSIAPRRIPQQKRGQRRVDGFLRAAASVIAEMGYERATMSAIAQRSHSSVGSLYQFFPNKLALAEALRNQYVRDIEQSWITLGRQAAQMSAADLTDRLVELQIEIIKNHPVLLALLDVSPASHARRQLIRGRIAEVLISHNPHTPKAMALRIASVVQQISRGLLSLYAQAEGNERIAIIDEFKSVLTGYLVPKLKP